MCHVRSSTRAGLVHGDFRLAAVSWLSVGGAKEVVPVVPSQVAHPAFRHCLMVFVQRRPRQSEVAWRGRHGLGPPPSAQSCQRGRTKRPAVHRRAQARLWRDNHLLRLARVVRAGWNLALRHHRLPFLLPFSRRGKIARQHHVLRRSNVDQDTRRSKDCTGQSAHSHQPAL